MANRKENRVVVHADDRGHFGPKSGPDYAWDVALPVAFLLDALAVPERERSAPAFAVAADLAPRHFAEAADLRTRVFRFIERHALSWHQSVRGEEVL